MITLKSNMVTKQDCYSLILIAWCMKLKLKMFIKILVIIRLSRNIMIIQTN